MSKYVIVDLEMCRVLQGAEKGKFGKRGELIEIGAVLLNENYEIADRFKTYVAPQFGEVDAFIQSLTGITRGDTKNAPSTEAALKAFADWLPNDAILVSWSENDENQIRKELELKEIKIPKLEQLLDKWEDCQKTFSEKMDSTRAYSLKEALIIADIDYDENIHDALVDARNTALLFAKMKKEQKLTLNAWLTQTNNEPAGNNPFADLLSGLSLAV